MSVKSSKMLRSALCLFLAVLMAMGTCVTAFATEKSTESDEGIKKYVSIGASNTNGYGLRGYLPEEVTEDPLAASKADLNVYGYEMAPADAYPAQIAVALGAEEFEQLAISSMRTEEVLYLLGEDYVEDDYMKWRFTGGQAWFAIAEEGGVPALREAYKDHLTDADVITIDIGWNNFGVYAFNNIKTILADGKYWQAPDFSATEAVVSEDDYYEIRASVLQYLQENITNGAALQGKMGLMLDVLTYATLGAIVHFDSIVGQIYEWNPEAQIVVINIQNLADDLVVEFEGTTLELGDLYGELIDLVNLYRASESPYADQYAFADAGDVETFLDEIVAWDGDPTTLGKNMVDCFDMYDDGLYVRSIVEYMMVGQALKELFAGFRTMAANYGLEVFKNDDLYTYEFKLDRSPEELLSLNLGALDLNNPAGDDYDVEVYGQALSAHLKNLRGDEANVDAYNYVFENLLAGLNAQIQTLGLNKENLQTALAALKSSGQSDEQYDQQVAEIEQGLLLFEAVETIIPAAKVEFANKLQGVYNTYHNTLNYAYDVVATVVQYVAGINNIEVNADSLNGFNNAADGMMDIVFHDVVYGAMDKFQYELYDNGLQALPEGKVPEDFAVADYELDESKFDPALRAILVLAIRYELGNSFFAHPNENGHDQITSAVLNARASSDAGDFTDGKLSLYKMFLQERYPNLYALIMGAQNVGQMDDLAIIINLLKASGNPALNAAELDALEASIRAAQRDYAESKTPEQQARAEEVAFDLMQRLYDLVAVVTGSDYEVTEDSYYVSLGDSTISGYGLSGYIDGMQNGVNQVVAGSAHVLLAQEIYGEEWKEHFGNFCQGSLRAEDLLLFLGGNVWLDDYYNAEIEPNLMEGTLEATQEKFIENVAQADLISVAIGGGNFLTFAGKYVNRVLGNTEGEPYALDWERIGVDDTDASMAELQEVLDLLVPVIDALGILDQYLPEGVEIENPAKVSRALAEGLLYGFISYNYYYTQVLDRIKEINPDAQLLVLGMFNPVDDWTMTVNIDGEEKVVNIGGAVSNLMGIANLQSLAYALQKSNTAFIDVSDAETILEAEKPGAQLGFSDFYSSTFQSNGKAVHASVGGHEYIADQMAAALSTERQIEIVLDQLYDLLMTYYDEAYAYAWDKAVENGYTATAIEYLGNAKNALNAAKTAVNAFAVTEELAETKRLLLEEIENTQATIDAIVALLESDDHTVWADYLTLKAELDAHMATIGALAAELNILVTPYLNQIVLAYCEYTALIEDISETAYAWLVENSETFAEEYAAWVDAVATAAGEIDPRLEAPVREYLTNTPADALSILYAYGSEAWRMLLVDASITGGEVYEILAGLNQTLYNHKDEIISIVENNEDVKALVEDIKALYADLESLYEQMLQAPISTAKGYQETFNTLKGELFELYGLLVEAVISAAGEVSPELGCALEDSYKALIKALSNAGADSGEYADWLGEHAGNMAGALVTMFLTNTEILGEQTLPVIGELVANLGEELWGYGSDVYDQVYAFITVCIPNWLGDVKAEAIETVEGIWDEVIQPKIDEFITWLLTTEGAIETAIVELYGLLVSYKEQIDEAVAQIESDIRNEIARIEGELEALYEQLANASGAAREEILAQIAALENELAAKKQELADAVKTALAQIDEDLPGMIDEAYNAFVDAVYEWAKETAPEVADYIYDYLYNNPAEVIGFFREYGDDAVAFATENIEVFAAVIGFVVYTFGDDIADYVMNNPEDVLAAMIGWYKEHGENTWELIKVYLDELGVIDAVVETVTDPEQMKAVFTELLAILQEYGPEMAQEAWDFALEQGYVAAAEQAVNDLLSKAKADLEAWLEDPEGFVNSAASELQAQLNALKEALAACQNELTNEVLAQIAALEAQLESLNEQLLTATGEVKEQIEAAIAVIEAAIEALEAKAAALEADIAAICEQIAAIEEELAELAEKTAAVGEKLVALVEQAEALKITLETLAADGLENLEENIDAVINTIRTGIDTIVVLSEEVQAAVAAAKDLADDVAAAVESIITAVDERINGFTEAVEAIGATVEAGLAPILEALNALANAAGDLSEEAKAQIEALEEEIASILAAAEETAAAIRAEFEEEIAALEQAVIEAAAALEAKKAELESAISEELAARKAEIEAQIADLTAQLEAKKAELAAKMAELEGAAEEVKAEIEAAIAEIEAAIAEIEAAIAEAEAILAEVNAEIQAAVAEIEAAVAELEQALADAEAALNAKIAEVEAAVEAAIAEAEAKAAELQAQIDALIAEAGEQIDAALKEAAAIVAAELEAVKEEVLTAAGEVVDAAVAAAEEFAAEAAAQAVAAAEALAAEVEEQVLAMGEVIDGYVDEFVAALEEAYEKATTGEYEITETNYYVALGDGSAVSKSYVDLLAAELELGEAYVNLAEDGLLPEELLAELAAGNMDYISEIAKADLITVGFSPATFANEQIERFANSEDLVEMDWLSLVGEQGMPYVEDAMAELNAYLLESGIEDAFLIGTISTIVESYAYSVVSFGANYAVLVDAIHEISPNAEVIIIGSYNAFNDVEFVFGDSALPMGEYMEKLTDLVNAYMVAYALIAENTTYVDITETETELTFEGQMEIDPTDFKGLIALLNMLEQFGDTIIPTEAGHEYIKNQILGVETIIEKPTGLWGDADSDGIVDSWDAAVVLEYDAGLNPDIDLTVSDVDGDGIVDSWDASLILEYDAGLRSSFPVEE